MANLIIICGPQAVGKMTVAESLRDKLKYNLMMNHDSIEISDKIFGFATPAQHEFNAIFREKAFEMAPNAETCQLLAIAYAEAGNDELSQKYYDKAIEMGAQAE